MDALSTSVPIVRIAASAAEADPAANVIAPVPGDRESCLAYVAGRESSLPPSYDVDRGIETFGPGYYKRLARTLTHLKAMVAAYRLDAPAVLILDANENPVTHPDFSFWSDARAGETDALAAFVADANAANPGWRHAQLSVLALSDAFGTLVQDWDEDGRPAATAVTPDRRARANAELWSYGAYLVSKQGLASTLLRFADRTDDAERSSSLRFDLRGASCVEADNCVLWEGVGGEGWLVATPPPFAPARQDAGVEDASDVEVPVSELVKENVYHVRRWWRSADDLLADARRGCLSVPSDQALDAMMREAGVDPADARRDARDDGFGADEKKAFAAETNRVARASANDDRAQAQARTAASSFPDSGAESERSGSAERGGASAHELAESSATAPPEARDDERVRSRLLVPDDALEEAAEATRVAEPATATDPATARGAEGASESADPAEMDARPAREMTAAEAADQARAGITRTESAFAFGNKLFQQTWGGSAGDPYVAAAGNGALDPAQRQAAAAAEDVMGVMEAYLDEPRLGAERRASLAALGDSSKIAAGSAFSGMKSPEALGAAAVAGVVAIAAAAVASRRRGAESETDVLERVALMA